MSELLHNPVVAKGAAGFTAATGLEAFFIQFVPQFLSMSATIVGIVLSVVLIMNHWNKNKRDKLTAELQQEKLRLEINHKKMQGE